MGYLGKQPSAVPLTTADLIDGSITNADIADLDAAKLTGTVNNARITLDAAEIPNLDAVKITTGTVGAARLGTGTANSTTVLYGDGQYRPEPVTDLIAIKHDINTLALHTIVASNAAAFALSRSFVDGFEDSTGITTDTDVTRNSAEYVSSIGSSEAYSAATDFEEDNFGTGTSGSLHSFSWVGNTMTHNYASQEYGCTTQDNGSGSPVTEILFPASQPFEYWFRPTGTTYGPYTLVCPTSYSGDNSCDPWKTATSTTWGQAGSMGIVAGSTALGYNGGLKYNPSSQTAPTHINGTNYNGTYCKIIRNASMELEFWSGGSYSGVALVHTSSATHSDAYEIIMGPQGGSYSNVMNDLKYRTMVTTAYSSATGTLISDTQTAPALTKMSGVVLVKDGGSSTTVMGTHLIISFSATNGTGSDWVNASSYTAVSVPFSTGVTMYKLGETTVPSGTSPTIRAVWASQTEGGYESQLHGWAMNY